MEIKIDIQPEQAANTYPMNIVGPYSPWRPRQLEQTANHNLATYSRVDQILPIQIRTRDNRKV